MAQRTAPVETEAPFSLTETLQALIVEGATGPDNAITIGDLSIAAAETTEVLFPLLSTLADLEIIDGGDGTNAPRGTWWVMDEISVGEAENAIGEAVKTHAAPAKPATPAERMKARKAAQPSATGVSRTQVAKGVTETKVIRHPSENKSTEVPEGTKVIGEDDMRQVVKSLTENKPATPAPVEPVGAWENNGGETHLVEYQEGAPITGHTILPVPDFIPAPPEGVRPNAWELYKTGLTLPARTFWGKIVAEQIKAHAERKEAEKITPPAPVITDAIDPVTGKPYQF